MTLTVKETAALMGVSQDTIYDWLASKRVPGRKIGGRWFVPKNQLILLLAGRVTRFDMAGGGS